MTSKTLTTFERRQVILRILEEQSGIKVTDLAQQLDVSEGTVRNDLAALDEEQQIMRVRGGAVPRSKPTQSNQIIAARARVNFDAKQRKNQRVFRLQKRGSNRICQVLYNKVSSSANNRKMDKFVFEARVVLKKIASKTHRFGLLF